MKAFLKNYRQSPRKVRLVTNLVRGKEVPKALTILSFMDKKAAPVVAKLLKSAVANAQAQGKEAADLFIKDIRVDQGIALRRFMPRAFGRATPFRRKSSHITVVLADVSEMKKKANK